MRVVVPFDATDPKSRLSPVLDAAERVAFAGAMRDDVCRAIRSAGGRPLICSTRPIDCGYPVRVDDRDLSTAINAALRDVLSTADACAIVMADCALATEEALRRLAVDGSAEEADLTLVPGRGGGTNALLVRTPAFAVDFHGASIRDHRAAARALDASVRELDSYRLATDVDAPADLVEVLLHGQGRAAEWLAERFTVAAAGGRVAVERRSDG